MKASIKKTSKQEQVVIYDPEPLTLVLTILGAISPVGVLIADKTINHVREGKKREQNIRNSLFAATRALNETERVLKDFVSFMDQQRLLDRDVRLGEASMEGDYFMISELKNLYKDSYNAGKRLNDAMIDLSSLLGNDDFHRIRRVSSELEETFQQALSLKKYKDFAISTSKIIQETKTLISIIGQGYDFNPFE